MATSSQLYIVLTIPKYHIKSSSFIEGRQSTLEILLDIHKSRRRSVPDLGIKISISVSVDLGLKPPECRSNRSRLHNFPT